MQVFRMQVVQAQYSFVSRHTTGGCKRSSIQHQRCEAESIDAQCKQQFCMQKTCTIDLRLSMIILTEPPTGVSALVGISSFFVP